MPTAPLSACPEPGCPNLTKGGRCPDHRRPNDDEFAPFYRSTLWKKLSLRVRREEPNCRRCGRPSQQADHILPLLDGGAALARANVQALCGYCNRAKRAEDAAKRGRNAPKAGLKSRLR